MTGTDRGQTTTYALAFGTLILGALLYILFDSIVLAMIEVPATHGQTEFSETFVDHISSIWEWFLISVLGFFVVMVLGASIFKSGRGV